MALPLIPIAIAAAAFLIGRKSATPLFVLRKDGRVGFSPAVANRVAGDMADWRVEPVPADLAGEHIVQASPGLGSHTAGDDALTAAMIVHAAGVDVWVSSDAGPTPRAKGSRVVAYIPAGFVPDTVSTTIAAVTVADARKSLKSGGSLLVLLAAADEPFPLGTVGGPTAAPGGLPATPPAPGPGQGLPGSPGGPGLGAGALIELDANMPLPVRQATILLLTQGTDPQTLLAAANVADQNGFPIAAAKLRARAAELAPKQGQGSGPGFFEKPQGLEQATAQGIAALVALGKQLGQPVGEEPETPALEV